MATAMAEGMIRLTKDMVVASDARLRAVDALVTGTRATLKQFRTDRGRMATKQAQDLADFTDELSQEVVEIRRKAQGLVRACDAANRRMSKEQSKRLAGFVEGLTRDVTSMLSRFDKERSHVSKELGERLGQEMAEIKASVERILKDAGSFRNEQRAGMAKARQAWRNMFAAINKAGRTDFTMPAAEAGPQACPTKHATPKTRGKKGTAGTKR